MEIVMKDLKLKLNEYFIKASYELFIEPLEIVSQSDNEIIFKTSNEWSKSIIEGRLMPTIQKVVNEMAEIPMEIDITTK